MPMLQRRLDLAGHPGESQANRLRFSPLVPGQEGATVYVPRQAVDQMTEEERRAYLMESLFLNTVKYENDKLEAYMRKLTK